MQQFLVVKALIRLRLMNFLGIHDQTQNILLQKLSLLRDPSKQVPSDDDYVRKIDSLIKGIQSHRRKIFSIEVVKSRE